MSENVVLQRSNVRLSWRTKWAARCAVGAARLLARKPPERIRATLLRLRGEVRPATYEEAKAARDAVLAVSLRCAGLRARSEEHTSELQSRENLVCRLLLEK